MPLPKTHVTTLYIGNTTEWVNRIVQLFIPKITKFEHQSDAFEKLKVTLQKQQRHSSWTRFGAELVVAGGVLSGALPDTELNPVTETKLRRLFMRPAIEPIIHSYWSSVFDSSPTNGVLEKFMSVVHGKSSALRRNNIYIENESGLRVYFTSPNEVFKYSDILSEIRNKQDDILCRALMNFAVTVIIHPFDDGNGRLSRALLSGGLGLAAGMTVPAIPLTPHIYIDLPQVVHLNTRLGSGGSWPSYIEALSRILLAAVLRQEKIESYIAADSAE